MALTRCITLLQCEMPTWFYHRHRHSVCLINNHGAKLKLKRNVALCSIILGVCVCKHPRWSLFCAHTRTKIRDSSSQFTIHVIKCNCISALLPSRSHCVASLSNCSSFIFFSLWFWLISARSVHSFTWILSVSACRTCISSYHFDFSAFSPFCWFLCFFSHFIFSGNACSIGAIYAPYYDYLCDLK